MPLPQNFNAILGAGVFGIVCAATLYVVERYRQDRRRHTLVKDVARLDNELAALRQELDTLLALQKQKATKRAKRNKKADSFIASSTTTDDYTGALDVDSSDLEFYDVSDDEVDATTLDKELNEIDLKLDGNLEELEECLERLRNLCIEHPENPHLLWRIAKVHYRLFEKTDDGDHLKKGIEAGNNALKFKPELADAHKWLACSLGERCKSLPMKEKILDGILYKEHVEAALRLNPFDPTLHFMLGRFKYDIAALKWYERKIAATLFAELPSGTFEEALEHYREADKLSVNEWKLNKLFMAKCQIQLGQIEEAVKVLEVADSIKTDNGADEEVDLEVKELLKKYNQ